MAFSYIPIVFSSKFITCKVVKKIMHAIIKFNGNDYDVSCLSGIDYGEKCLGPGTWDGTKGGIWEVGCDYGVTLGQSARGWEIFCATGNPFTDPCIVRCGIWSKKQAPPLVHPPPPPPNGCEAQEIYLTIYVKQPVLGRRDPFNKNTWDVGHTFIGVKVGNRPERMYGFYGVDYPYWKVPLDLMGIKKFNGVICDDSKIRDENKKPNIKKTWKISKEGCKKLKDFLEKSIKNPPQYDLQKYNCTDFAKDAAKIAGIKDVPKGDQTPWPILNIHSSNPGDMGEDLLLIGGKRIEHSSRGGM